MTEDDLARLIVEHASRSPGETRLADRCTVTVEGER